jgi:wyosine [tRNA(Phe)-imidazoG37] synthetase (radical SAM superfamily)
MKYKYIYGPVPSWRLGSSLGIDLLSGKEKICNFDCIYCQLGKTRSYTTKRALWVSSKDVIAEVKDISCLNNVDYITFSGRGEPTLANNLAEVIKDIRKIRKEPIAVLTNSSLLYIKKVRGALLLTDFVSAKLDADSEKTFIKINRASPLIKFSRILEGIEKFRKEFKKKFALQIMFVKENLSNAKEIAKLAKEIAPDEVQLNTPLRPSKVKPLSLRIMSEVKEYFKGLNVILVYEAEHKKVKPISSVSTLRRRGKI